MTWFIFIYRVTVFNKIQKVLIAVISLPSAFGFLSLSHSVHPETFVPFVPSIVEDSIFPYLSQVMYFSIPSTLLQVSLLYYCNPFSVSPF